MAAPFRHAIVPIAALAGTLTISAANPIYAEEMPDKKPIYTAPPRLLSPPAPTPTKPTPTDQLAEHIGTGRRFINAHYRVVSSRLEAAYSQYLSYEHRVSSTIASLRPQGPETVVSGVMYVAIATMAGGIVFRRRMLPIRALGMAAVGLGTAKVVLPETTRNVGGLVWEWEQKFPEVVRVHAGTTERVEKGVRDVREGAEGVKKKIEQGVKNVREKVESLVKRG